MSIDHKQTRDRARARKERNDRRRRPPGDPRSNRLRGEVMRRCRIPQAARPVFVVETEADDGRTVNMYVQRAGDVFYASLSEDGATVYVRQYSGRNLRHLHEELAPLLERPHTSGGRYESIPREEK